jgi:hypothetical protein
MQEDGAGVAAAMGLMECFSGGEDDAALMATLDAAAEAAAAAAVAAGGGAGGAGQAEQTGKGGPVHSSCAGGSGWHTNTCGAAALLNSNVNDQAQYRSASATLSMQQRYCHACSGSGRIVQEATACTRCTTLIYSSVYCLLLYCLS